MPTVREETQIVNSHRGVVPGRVYSSYGFGVGASKQYFIYLMPAGRNPAGLRQPSWNIVGRLKNGMTPEQAQAELRTMTARQAQTDRDFEGFAPRVQPLPMK